MLSNISKFSWTELFSNDNGKTFVNLTNLEADNNTLHLKNLKISDNDKKYRAQVITDLRSNVYYSNIAKLSVPGSITVQNFPLNQLSISVITQAELYYGAINKVELQKIRKHLKILTIFPVDVVVSTKFIELMETYSLSHKLAIPDALIAFTALVYNLDLYTLNLKDFRFIESLNLYSGNF
jgi:predicted nucleic acid-binding protein